LAVTGWLVRGELRARVAHVEVVGLGGAPVAGGRLEFFVYDDSGAARSPSEKLGELAFDGVATAGYDLVPERALVRVSADGLGVGYGLARSGAALVCELGPPVETAGQVVDSAGRGVEGASVYAFGGGPHGVLLRTTKTGVDGGFRLSGLSSTLASVHLRVLAPSFAVAAVEWWFDAAQSRQIALSRTQPVIGRVVMVGRGDTAASRELVKTGCAGMRVQAVNLPGVDAVTDAEGGFLLDHLPAPPTVVQLTAAPLPRGYTHARVSVEAGQRRVELLLQPEAVVTGRVIDVATGLGVGGATVSHAHGPCGNQAVRCDSSGGFRIDLLPPGRAILEAYIQRREPGPDGRVRPVWRQLASAVVELTSGEHRGGVTLRAFR
jgi:hypothetical protein